MSAVPMPRRVPCAHALLTGVFFGTSKPLDHYNLNQARGRDRIGARTRTARTPWTDYVMHLPRKSRGAVVDSVGRCRTKNLSFPTRFDS
ncbi:hypothetical protein BV25DRAFT_1275121 [Artomyces pyxidatus]|uniref:Uncharacterized protein n=1 Tax=Artomyces pyxidatus TaxID=48021 RepID=A0ACB8TF85_9AGAM|nr:hypothetical protein BV25DRAFT_1275121 [Artomyces pyxidatus]